MKSKTFYYARVSTKDQNLDACFEVANDTDICYLVNPDCTVVYAARMGLHYETSIIPAGEYTGIAEFTVSVEPKVM